MTRELASLGEVTKPVRAKVLEEFYRLALAQTWASEGGLDYARSLLAASLDPSEADRILQQIRQQVRAHAVRFPAEGRDARTC